MKIHTTNDAIPAPLPGRKVISGKFVGLFAPHARTSRASYTVPANKRARYYSSHLSMYLESTAGSHENAACSIELTIGAVGPTTMHEVNLHGIAKDIIGVSHNEPDLMLEAGDKIELFTVDTNTDGTFMYGLHYFLLEFDG